MSTFVHDPDSRLDYALDWSAWLEDGETITSFEVAVPSGITLESSSETGGKVTMWISGGTTGQLYAATCHIVSNQGREDDRTIKLRVRER